MSVMSPDMAQYTTPTIKDSFQTIKWSEISLNPNTSIFISTLYNTSDKQARQSFSKEVSSQYKTGHSEGPSSSLTALKTEKCGIALEIKRN